MHPRAQWSALRTFHRRVKPAGRTAAGQPTFVLGTVQLTYPPGAGHFYRLAACARCGEIIELPEPVLAASDLELTGQPHLCQACARSGIENLASRAVRPPPLARPPAATPAGADAGEGLPEDDLDRAATDVSTIVGPAMFRAEEIVTEARRTAADLVAEARREAAALRSAAAAEHEKAQQERAKARALLADAGAQVVELRAEAVAAGETAQQEREQARALLAGAESEAAEMRATADADATLLRDAGAQADAHARALLADAEVRAAEIRATAEAELEAAISLSGTPPLPTPGGQGRDVPPVPAAEEADPPADPQPEADPPADPQPEADPPAGSSSPGDDGAGDGHEA